MKKTTWLAAWRLALFFEHQRLKFLACLPTCFGSLEQEANDMGYGVQDSAALNAAQAAGFDPRLRETGDLDRLLTRLQCPDTPLGQEPAKLLAAAIEAARRYDDNMTVWLDVGNPETIPEYVHRAIESMCGFGANIVVTQAGRCSHGPQAELLDPKLQEAIYQANGPGCIWHPIVNQLVYVSRYPHGAAVH